MLDTGTIGIGNTTKQVCPYSVNIFDLRTNQRIHRYQFRPEDTNPNTFIANTAVDIGKTCDDTFAYFSDELGYGLIVYSLEQNKSWRFAHSYFYPDPLRGDYNIAGMNFQWGEEGIFGMALSPIKSDGFRTLYFSPLASHREFSVSTRILRDESRVEDSFHDFTYQVEERGANSHTTARVMSDDGVMLFNLVDQNSVGCWHSSMPYSPKFHGIVDRDDVGLVFPADVKIDENHDVWVLSDRMPVFLIAELDYSDVNFRIYTAPLSALIAGTVCDLGKKDFGRFNQQPFISQNPLSVGQPGGGGSAIGLGGYKTKTNVPAISSIPSVSSIPPISTYQTRPVQNTVVTYKAPNALYPSTVRPSANAYVYNDHNGVSYETNSPHEFTHAAAAHGVPKADWWTRHFW